MHGSGLFTWSDEKSYQGDFKNDKFNGYGVFKWPTGVVYKGNWQNGEMHGEGELTTENKEVF